MAGPRRDTLKGFRQGECVELKGAVLRVGVHVASGELVSVFSRRTKREHLLVRLLKGDVVQPMGVADAGTAPPPGTWRVTRKSQSRATLAAEGGGLRFIRVVRLLADGMAEVRTTAEPARRRATVQFGVRAPLVPGGGGIHGHTNTGHFGHHLFIRTDGGLVEQGHRKYSNSRYEWAYPQWAAFVDTVRREGIAFLFRTITPRISVSHDWNEMMVTFRSAHQDAAAGAPAEFVYRICVFDGVDRVDHLDETGLSALDVPATIVPGEAVTAQLAHIPFRPGETTVTAGWEGDARTRIRRYRARLRPYRAWRRRLTVGPFPDPIEVKYAEYVSKPARVWLTWGGGRTERLLADTPSITSAQTTGLAVSALTGRVRGEAADLVAEARRRHETGNLPREGLAVCLALQRFLQDQMRREAWTEETRSRAFRRLSAMRAAVDAGPRIGRGRVVPDADAMRSLLADPVTAPHLTACANRARGMDQDVPLGATKLRQTWGANDTYPFAAARANAVAHAITGEQVFLERAKRDLLKIARNHLVYGSVLGESLFIAVQTLGTLEACDVVQPHLTLDEEVDVLDYLLWCGDIFFDDVNLTGSNHDSWHAAALAWLARRFAYLPEAPLWQERCAAVLRHHVNYQLADGGWTEQSPTYHDMNVRSFVLGAEALRGSPFDLYAEVDGKSLRRMVQWSIAMAGPETRYSALDDSHGGRPSVDTILLAAAAYGDPHLLGYARRLIDAGLGISEPLAIWRYPRDLDPADPAPLCLPVLDGTGHVIFRSTHDGASVRAILQYGPHGGWHGHYDKLALEVMIDGASVLTDPGAALYEDAIHWTWHRTTRAHNTVEVDDRSQEACCGRLIAHREDTRQHLAVAEAEPYPGVTHERAVLHVKGLGFVVLDRLTAREPHDYRLYWHGAEFMDLSTDAVTFTAAGAPPVAVIVPGCILAAGSPPPGVKEPFVTTVSKHRKSATFLSVIVPGAHGAAVSAIVGEDTVTITRGDERSAVRIDPDRPDRRLWLKA